MDDIRMGLRNLLISKWKAANTSSITPTVSTGWYDSKNPIPQVTITNPSETAISEGPAGFFGIVTNGTPTQYFAGSVAIDLWAVRGSVNPKQLLFQMKEECKRIFLENYDQIADYDFIVWRGGDESVDTKTSPATFRGSYEVGFGYLNA